MEGSANEDNIKLISALTEEEVNILNELNDMLDTDMQPNSRMIELMHIVDGMIAKYGTATH